MKQLLVGLLLGVLLVARPTEAQQPCVVPTPTDAPPILPLPGLRPVVWVPRT